MRSIKARFIKAQSKNQILSDLSNFASAIKNQKFSSKRIREAFYSLVDREDYDHLDGSEKKQLFSWLESL